ncbi:hypothetical protein Hdeb2414_s0628g00926711 [Helianthus debilis subsp. tardiflorus]
MITNNQAFRLPIIFLIFLDQSSHQHPQHHPQVSTATSPIFISLINLNILVAYLFSSIAEILSGIASNTLSALFKWMWSLKPDTKISTGVSSRSMVKYEGGYSVETVFDEVNLGLSLILWW